MTQWTDSGLRFFYSRTSCPRLRNTLWKQRLRKLPRWQARSCAILRGKHLTAMSVTGQIGAKFEL